MAASVETYVDQAAPPTTGLATGQPLSAGDLTMQDVLKVPTSAKNKAANPVAAPLPTSTTPQLKTGAQGSSAGVMLMEGMQSALRQSGVNPATPLQAPRLPSDRAAALAASAATSTQPAAASTVSSPTTLTTTDVFPYQPGQAPKNLLSGLSGPAATAAPAAPTPAAPAEEQQPINVAPVSNGPAIASAAGCTPQVTSWVKTCAEAGYPDSYVGQIRGETRSTCPAGGLEDVWISNGCVPPDEPQTAAAPAAPLTAPSTAPAVVAETPVQTEQADGSCGVSNGLAANARPIYDLCASGKPTSVTGDGPWRWNCQGISGGMTVSCAAPVASATPAVATPVQQSSVPNLEDAKCGAADGVVADNAPSASLCLKGAASRVNGSGPWTWACSGTNGGRPAACSAPKKTDGVCGSANATGVEQMPMSNLCDAGYASAVTGNGPWAWTCSGLNGGQAATCSAAPKQDAVCGPASLSGRSDAPKNALCSVGQAGAVSGTGPWNWACSGLNGGASVSCEARVSVSGACGLAHGTSVTEAPSDNLCAIGKPSRLVGNGPWNWTCSGADGGDTASCTAARASERVPVPVPPLTAPKSAATTKPALVDHTLAPAPAPTVEATNLCGTAGELVAIEAPSKNLCKSGTASSVSGHGPWNWTCTEGGAHQSCSTLSLAGSDSDTPAPEAAPTPAVVPAAPVEPQAAACGNASGQGTAQEPSSDLCAVGKASSVKGHGPWTWSCSKGKSHASCEATVISDGACGAANGSVQKYAPTSGLCTSGKATQIQGSGPWIWSCVGEGGGASISCSATSQAQTRVDGSCGASSNASLTATPAANLCDSGVASSVYGEGPWTWTCSGLNGGVAASCSAQKNTPAAPPPPAPAVNGLCGASNGVAMVVQPMDNLCTTGTATAVSGNGPWNWNCLGENSGMTVSCTAPMQPPAPISGVCGAANGVPTLTTPKSGLCSGGISSAVSGKGPWTWSCSGVNGGSAVGCVAPLAGTSVGSLPSMTTQSNMDLAPAPQAAPANAVTKKGLVTPRLPSGSLPPLSTGNLPPAPSEQGMMAPQEAPQLPADTQGVVPPPVRDTIQPSPALRTDESGNVLPGNHFVLDAELSTVPFAHGTDNYDSSVVPKLSKLADVLTQNSGVRITLTAYADNAGTTPREARRLSLSRALALRDYLTSKGISSARIDVRALGANVPSGEPDRVDIQAN